MNYNVGDLIIRIKNSALAKRKEVILPYSKVNKAITKVLVKEQYLDAIREEEKDGKKILVGIIRYEKRRPVLSDAVIVSKPSLRVYIAAEDIVVRQRRSIGILILSTSKGIMTGEGALKAGVGGEVLFEVS